MTATQLCTAMLPILRVLPVGGVLLAILILVLALTPPDGSRGPLSSPGVPARGALSDRDRQAETRQFLIHAALKRADQLSRLRDLPDTPAHSEEPQPEVAGLPAERSDADPEESGSINETPANTIPIEIGGPSMELPIPSPQDTPLTVRRPEQSKAQRDTRRRVERPRRTTVTGTQSRPLNFFEILFGQQSASISQQAGAQPYPYPVFGPHQVRQYQYPAYSYQQYQQPTSSSVQTGYQQYQQPAYASQQTGYQQQYQQPAHGYQQTGQQRQQPQSGYANQQAGQSTRAR
ncbi:MAG TPA: hypothetical protein VFP79_15065 [Pseudolabrys sp.]|nr:hypothetical protein [Pseudolabrys sp.]